MIIKKFISILCLICIAINSYTQKTLLYKDSEAPIEERIEDLIARMTLEEKLGQMWQKHTRSIGDAEMKSARNGALGSMLNGRNRFFTVENRNALQRAAVSESRLGIPIIFGHDVIHGFRTILPICLAQSCSWSPELVKKGASLAAFEASAAGVDWTFGPMVDVSRDPRWGRITECFGEDPYMNSMMAEAAVRGFQGDDLSSPMTIAACMKHYVGYGAAEGGRDYNHAELSEITLREVYLPPFRAGIDAGAQTVMSAFNAINGIPASANLFTLTTVLRNEWQFDGFVVSDWDAVTELLDHGFAADTTEAALKALTAGVNMEMKSKSYAKLKSLVDNGIITETHIDNAVRNILRVKFRLGLFERPYVDESREKSSYLRTETRLFACKLARASMVLLENDNNVLPIDAQTSKNIAVIGPFAKNSDLLGWWKSTGKFEDVITFYDGLQRESLQNIVISDTVLSETDAIIVCVGESRFLFGESHSRSDLTLPENQERIIQEAANTGKPVIVVIANGRPIDLSGIVDYADAILLAWHPGVEAGNALADIIYGTYNPSAKLTTSFPNSVGQIPVHYNYRVGGRPKARAYVDNTRIPLFPFGYGLSYTTFEYSGLKLSAHQISITDSLEINVSIKNTGQRAGEEVVQLYTRDLHGSVTRPVKELKRFKKIALLPEESEQVKFILTPSDFACWNIKMEYVVEPGDFKVWVGPNSVEGIEGRFTIVY